MPDAFEDLILLNLGTFGTFLGNAVQRWTKALMDARSPNYTWDDLFENARAQFLDNWDTFNELARFSGYPLTPSVTIEAAFGSLNGKNGTVYVRRRLTGIPAASFTCTDLVALDASGNKISGANVVLTLPKNALNLDYEYDFDGLAVVTLTANAPAAGVYQGLMLLKVGGAKSEPLTTVIVVAT